jgi:stage II sporulation protein D
MVRRYDESTIRVRGAQSTAIRAWELEAYTEGVLAAEGSVDWPDEALMALSIACRSYGMRRVIDSPHIDFDVVDSVLDQAFLDPSAAPGRLRDLVDRTHGQHLSLRQGGWQRTWPFPALYHHSCGGATDTAQSVWGAQPTADVVATCPPCITSAPRWQASFAPEVLGNAAGLGGSSGITLEVVDRTPAGRARLVAMAAPAASETLSGEQLRAALGYRTVASARFEVSSSAPGGDITIEGTGYGHGVGLCVLGARVLAADGAHHRDILALYYPDAQIRRTR